MRIYELREKEVINIRDGRRLGIVVDVDFNPITGEICQLIIPCPGKFFGFWGHDGEYTIGWKCVKQLGSDIILVDVDLEQCYKQI